LSLTWSEAHIYGSDRIGILNTNLPIVVNNERVIEEYLLNTEFTHILAGMKKYELTNHLGNVLSVITDRRLYEKGEDGSEYYVPDVVSATDYYPFGWAMPGRTYTAASYKYGFNGKENDNEVKGEGNQQDYGMRIYDPRLGRFLSVDPISKEYPELTPYQFASNRPIDGIDMDGLEWMLPPYFMMGELPPIVRIATAEEFAPIIENIKINEPIQSPAGIPRFTPNGGRIEMSRIGRIGHKTVETSSEFLNRYSKFNRELTKGNRPDGWHIDIANKVIRIGEIKSATKTGIKNGLSQLERYVKVAQEKYPDYSIHPELWQYNSNVPVVYKLKDGDTASGIAKQYGTTLDNLQLLNPKIKDFNTLKAGQDIIVDKVKSKSK
jgi:RHS repeat-associated protein